MYGDKKKQQYEARVTIVSDQEAFTAFRRAQNPEFTDKDGDEAWGFHMSLRPDLEEKVLFDVTKHYVDGWKWARKLSAPFSREPIISRNGPSMIYPIPAVLGPDVTAQQGEHKERLDRVLVGDIALMAIYAENCFYATLAQEHFKKTGEDTHAAFRQTAQELMLDTEESLGFYAPGSVADLNSSIGKNIEALRVAGKLKI